MGNTYITQFLPSSSIRYDSPPQLIMLAPALLSTFLGTGINSVNLPGVMVVDTITSEVFMVTGIGNNPNLSKTNISWLHVKHSEWSKLI